MHAREHLIATGSRCTHERYILFFNLLAIRNLIHTQENAFYSSVNLGN